VQPGEPRRDSARSDGEDRAGSEQAADAADWLRALQQDGDVETGGQPAQDDALDDGGAVEGEMPDWLARIRSRSQEEQDSPPDWLRELKEEDQAEAPQDDLSRLAGLGGVDDHQVETSAPAQDAPATDETEESIPAWLRDLSDERAEALPEAQDQNSPQELTLEPDDGEDFSWLRGLTAADEQTQPGAPDASEWEGGAASLSDIWVAQEEQPAAEDAGAGRVEDAGSGGLSLTGFLNRLEQEQQTSEQDTGASTGWTDGAQSYEEPVQVQPPAGDLPDWLRGAADDDAMEPGAGPLPPVGTGLPAWLRGAPSPDSSSGEAPVGDLPDWLRGSLPAQQPPAEDAGPDMDAGPSLEGAPEQAVARSGLPEWLSDAEAEEPEEGSGLASNAPEAGWSESGWTSAGQPSEALPAWPAAPAGADLPDWFSVLDAEPGPAVRSTDADSFPTGAAAYDPEMRFEDQSPEQEAAVSGEPEETPANPVPTGQAGVFLASDAAGLPGEVEEPEEEDAGAPDWLRAFQSLPAEDETAEPEVLAGPFTSVSAPVLANDLQSDRPFDVDLPDWLSEDTHASGAGDRSTDATGLAAGEGEPLEQAELPDWVKGMRPIETLIPGEAQMAQAEKPAQAEKSGPLAGLAGILPVEDLSSRYTRPPVYSARLRVTEKQKTQAAHLDNLLALETQPLLTPVRRRRGQGLGMRILVALLLIVALAIPIVTGMSPLATPTLSPDETQQMFEQIDTGFAPGAPVLLSVDFDPGLSGEMRLAALPVVEHLMRKGARIVVVSTRPTGPALAQQLLASAAETQPGYDLAGSAINLGFLPGDTISLFSFVRQPILAAPANLGGELAWGSSVLEGVQGIEDFAQVVVLTDTAETGRAWVEQVQPFMGDVPLMMVTSAQAAPMMAPFVESGQVDGMVSGLLGGVLYGGWAQQETGAGRALAAYQVGVLLALGLALVSGLISGGMALFRQNDKAEE
jgi:hypothetical protein